MGGMTIATCLNEDLTETEDERCVFACTDRREVRRTDKSERGRKIGKDTWQ